jgi:hypothetical protein
MIFLVVVYFMNGLPAEWYRFSLFSLIAITVCLVAEGLGLAIGSVFNVTVSMYICSDTPQSCSKGIEDGLSAYLGNDVCWLHESVHCIRKALRKKMLLNRQFLWQFQQVGEKKNALNPKNKYCNIHNDNLKKIANQS